MRVGAGGGWGERRAVGQALPSSGSSDFCRPCVLVRSLGCLVEIQTVVPHRVVISASQASLRTPRVLVPILRLDVESTGPYPFALLASEPSVLGPCIWAANWSTFTMTLISLDWETSRKRGNFPNLHSTESVLISIKKTRTHIFLFLGAAVSPLEN